MNTEEKRELIVTLVTKILEEMNEYFNFSSYEIDILVDDIMKSLEKMAEKRLH